MSNTKYGKWRTAQGLQELTAMAEAGMSDREMAKNMGVSQATFRGWMKRWEDMGRAVETGRAGAEKKVEHALLKRALGYTYMEITYERAEDKDGNSDMVVKRQVEKQVVPDLSAIMIWLKNNNPEKWDEKQEPEQDIVVRLTDN